MSYETDPRAFVVRIDARLGSESTNYFVETLEASQLRRLLPMFAEDDTFKRKLLALIRNLQIGESLRVVKVGTSVHVDVRDGRPRLCPICGKDAGNAATCGRDECFEANVQRQARSRKPHVNDISSAPRRVSQRA